MLSINTIDRALENKDYDRLLRDLTRNGLVMPLPLRVQLAESAVGARGLGLRRLVELTYGPTALSRQLISSLLRAQSPTGAALDAAGRPSCLLTAALAAGLGRVLRDHRDSQDLDLAEIRFAYDRALGALACMQSCDALFAGSQDRDLRDRLLTSAFVAYLLIDAPDFAGICRGHELLSVLEDHLEDADPDTEQLIGMARLARLTPVEPVSNQPAQAQSPQLTIAA
ncbi:MAG: hypothetical protein ACPG4Q_14360 [Phycisphaeraceae bacterium]